MTDDDLKTYIQRFLRQAFHKSGLRGDAIRLAKIGPGLYECAECHQECTASEINVDHTDPCVDIDGWKDWNTFIKRLFTTELTVLCIRCHKRKTAKENAKRWTKK